MASEYLVEIHFLIPYSKVVLLLFSVAFLKNPSGQEISNDHFPESLKKEEQIKSLDRRKGFKLKTQSNHRGEHRLFAGDLGK